MEYRGAGKVLQPYYKHQFQNNNRPPSLPMRYRQGQHLPLQEQCVCRLLQRVEATQAADLAAAMMSINAVKAVEIGSGMATARMTGEENADEIRIKNGEPVFLSNNAGGILGGISTGQDIVVRFAVKPTSSILNPLRTINKDGLETDIITKGRHDPCVGIRAVPIGEAMMACTLVDHMLRHRAQCG